MVDFAKSGAKVSSVCGRCAEIKIQPPLIHKFAMIEGSWNGCALFRDRRFFPRVSFCTKEIIDLANANSLTNCRFVEMAGGNQTS